MYHDRYTRRRTTDSLADDEEVGGVVRPIGNWSWRLFFAVLLIQVTSRSLWSSLGIITCALLGEQVPAWHMLAVPTAFSVSWGITEACMKRVCSRMGRTDDFMYAVLGGTSLTWLCTLVAVKCPLTTLFLVLLIGVLGGCGASMSATAANELVRKHLPNRSGAVRFSQQISAAASFFLIPVLSYWIMDTFGEHGGLLIHSGIIMQGLIGGILVRGAKWEDTSERIVFLREDGAFFSSDCSYNDEESRCSDGEQRISTPSPVNRVRRPISPPSPTRLAFGLQKIGFETAEIRRQRFAASRGLPSITEEAEQDDSSTEVLPPLSSPNTPEPLAGSNLAVEPQPPIVMLDGPEKPPRSFVHVFPSDRLLPTSEKETRRSSEERRANYDSETGEVEAVEDTEEVDPATHCRILRLCVQEIVAAVWGQTQRARPLAVPAALLLASLQMALLNFAGLTPLLLNYHIIDGDKVDGAYTICVMGFTWTCLVLASPCFATIHISNHQAICMASLFFSAFTLYLMSTAETQDEIVLYGSLFGFCHGISHLTTHSTLKMGFGSEGLHQLGLPLSILAGAFHLLTLLLISQCDLGEHIKQMYLVPASLLVVSALIWSMQCCMTSLRANRGRHDFTWSRRRRLS